MGRQAWRGVEGMVLVDGFVRQGEGRDGSWTTALSVVFSSPRFPLLNSGLSVLIVHVHCFDFPLLEFLVDCVSVSDSRLFTPSDQSSPFIAYNHCPPSNKQVWLETQNPPTTASATLRIHTMQALQRKCMKIEQNLIPVDKHYLKESHCLLLVAQIPGMLLS
jgi:hypothetical protein